MINYCKRQINEITQDWTLSLYGMALALTHIWTYIYWNSNNFFLNSQSGINAEPICFPWFPNCDLFRQSISMESWTIVLYTYLALSCLCVGFFTVRRTIGLGYFLLIVVSFYKFFLHMSNYNFMGNYHYMIYCTTLAYLFLPHKKAVLKHLIVLYYLAAGFLKINIDWLSGAAMIRSPYIGGSLLVISLFYVVVLELIFVFGLLHKNKWIRWVALFQFLAFHAFSWHIVGFFYPMVMFCILSLFIFDEWLYLQNKQTTPDHLLNLFNGQARATVYAVIVVFSILQTIPFLLTPDPSLSGTARLPSLNMFDSKTRCHAIMVADTEQGTIHIRRPMKNLGTRLKCDPLIYLNQAYQICRENKKSQDVKKLSLTLFSKRVTRQKFVKVLDIKDLCSLDYPLWAELYGDKS